MTRSYWSWAVATVAMLCAAGLVTGCLPPAVPEEMPEQAAEPFEPPPPAVRPMVISPVNITPPPYAHRMVPVRDRNYRLRSAASIEEYDREVRRQVMRLSLEELEREMATTGWSPYMTIGPVPEELIPEPPRGDYDASTHREWLQSRQRSWFDTDYDWPGLGGGSSPATDQTSLRQAWVPIISGPTSGGAGPAGGGMGGMMMGGPGPMMGGMMMGPSGGGMGGSTGAGAPMMSSAPMLPE